jgi:asparagine synthase (glutamine-hydrolysing)
VGPDVGTTGDSSAAFASAAISASASNVRLVADARIDNLDDLRRSLDGASDEAIGHTLIRAYLAWGPSFADRLLGDFAIVLWDGNRRTLVAARDPFGVRPLFHASRDGRLWLASRVAPLLGTLPAQASLEAALDDEAVLQYVLWRYRMPSTSFYRNIREVPAGHVLVETSDARRVERYWRPPEPRGELERAGREEIFEELRALFRRAVERRLRSPAPVVVHVSGGLDSSAIAMAANELALAGRTPNVIGASAVFPGLECDESAWIDAVANSVSFPIERWDGTRSDSIDLVDPLREGPGARIASTSGTSGDLEIAARHGATTILSGLGGDDLMTVSGITRDFVTNRQWRAAWESVSAAGFSSQAAHRRLRTIAAQFLPARLLSLRARATATVPDWLAPGFRGVARDILASRMGEGDPPLSSLVRTNMWARVNAAHAKVGVSLLQGVGMPLGIEFRFPYLDRELVTFALSVPAHGLPGLVPTARLHREAFRPMLPPAVAARVGKADLTPALRNRLRRAQPRIEALCNDGRSWASHRFVDPDAARRLLRAGTSRPSSLKAADLWHVWRVATLETWTRSILLYGMRQ